jgi:O-antigen/teichoic acid export membrane protein
MIPHSFAITLYSYLSGQQPGSGVENKISFGYVLESMWPAYAFAAFAMVAVIAGGKYFLAHWFPAYLPVFPIMRLLAVLLLVRTINITLTAILYSFGRYTTLLKITGTNLLANVVFAFALIPSFGLWGAGLAALLTETWNCCAQWRAVWASVSFMREQGPVCRFEGDAKPDADLVAP